MRIVICLPYIYEFVCGQGIYRNTATMVRFLFLEVLVYQLVCGDRVSVTADARER